MAYKKQLITLYDLELLSSKFKNRNDETKDTFGTTDYT